MFFYTYVTWFTRFYFTLFCIERTLTILSSCLYEEDEYLKDFYEHAKKPEIAKAFLNQFCTKDKIRSQECLANFFGTTKALMNNSDIANRIMGSILDFICDNQEKVTGQCASYFSIKPQIIECLLNFHIISQLITIPWSSYIITVLYLKQPRMCDHFVIDFHHFLFPQRQRLWFRLMNS